MGLFPQGLWTNGPRPPAGSRISLSYVLKVLVIHLLWILNSSGNYSVMGTECMKRKYYELTVTFSYHGTIRPNRTLKCDMYFQWTVADYCCYDRYDRDETSPSCCYSETYKLVLAVGFICLVLLASSFSIFFCWVYNLPHHIMYLLTCGRFHLNNWMIRNKNGPYVDPSFYSGEPFWARGAEMQPYPLRPMPPKIFYPAPPAKLKYRWDMANGEIPLFIIASRQFTRNPYSARPQDRNITSSQHNLSQASHQQSLGALVPISESRRSSLANSNAHLPGSAEDQSRANSSHPYGRERDTSSALNGALRRGSSALMPYRGSGYYGGSMPPHPPFRVNIDEEEAASELIEALKMLDERGDKTVAEWNAMSSLDPRGDSDIFMLTDDRSAVGSTVDIDSVRPNTTGAGGTLDHYGNYVSLTNHSSLGLNPPGGSRPTKPNTEALNQQFSTLGLPVYSMPGVHTAGVVNTVQNYHVVSSNLGNPMETILEDDSLDEDFISAIPKINQDLVKLSSSPGSSSSSTSNSPAHLSKMSQPHSRRIPHAPLKRRATINTPNIPNVLIPSPSSRVSSAMDHVVVPRATARAVVPFSPTLPGSLPERGSTRMVDAAFIDAVVNQIEPTAGRRNSIV